MPTCPPVPLDPAPSSNLVRLATYATLPEKVDFRRTACKRADFLAVVHDEIKGEGAQPYDCLNAEEAAFVVGWIYATEHTYIDEGGSVDDAKLVAAITQHLFDPQMTG